MTYRTTKQYSITKLSLHTHSINLNTYHSSHITPSLTIKLSSYAIIVTGSYLTFMHTTSLSLCTKVSTSYNARITPFYPFNPQLLHFFTDTLITSANQSYALTRLCYAYSPCIPLSVQTDIRHQNRSQRKHFSYFP